MRPNYLFLFICILLLSNHHSAKADDWVRAESTQFVVFSNGSTSQASKAALELERLDALLRRLWRRDPNTSGSKLEVYLLKDSRAVSRMVARTERVRIAGLYRPQAYGSFFLGNRRKSKFDEVLTGREVLFHEYAHHFFYQNFAVPAPAWFSEGFADYVSSSEVPESGGWSIGRPLAHRRDALLNGGQVPIRDLLTGKDRRNHLLSFYAWSWGLTRFLYSAPQGRGSKISQYLSLLNDGVEHISAAEQAFGDLDAFERELAQFAISDKTFRRSSNPLQFATEIELSELDSIESQLIELRLMRLNGSLTEDGLERLREFAAQTDASADAWYELAQAQLSFVDGPNVAIEPEILNAIQSAIDRSLALNPEHMRANVLQGRILLQASEDAPSEQVAAGMVETAIKHFRRATAKTPSHPWPIFNLARGLQFQGSAEGERSELITRAFELAPESVQIRFSYAADLANNGAIDRAIALLAIVANDPHGRGGSAATMIERLQEMRDRTEPED